jgi:hypothetical protein
MLQSPFEANPVVSRFASDRYHSNALLATALSPPKHCIGGSIPSLRSVRLDLPAWVEANALSLDVPIFRRAFIVRSTIFHEASALSFVDVLDLLDALGFRKQAGEPI